MDTYQGSCETSSPGRMSQPRSFESPLQSLLPRGSWEAAQEARLSASQPPPSVLIPGPSALVVTGAMGAPGQALSPTGKQSKCHSPVDSGREPGRKGRGSHPRGLPCAGHLSGRHLS